MDIIVAIAGFVGRLIVWCVGTVLVDAMIVDPIERWNGRRLAKASTFHCGIRVVSGHLPGFAKSWRHGATTISPGIIHFKDETISVIDLAAHARQPMMGECSWSSFDHRVVAVTTAAAVIEFAARTPQMPTIRQSLTLAE